MMFVFLLTCMTNQTFCRALSVCRVYACHLCHLQRYNMMRRKVVGLIGTMRLVVRCGFVVMSMGNVVRVLSLLSCHFDV